MKIIECKARSNKFSWTFYAFIIIALIISAYKLIGEVMGNSDEIVQIYFILTVEFLLLIFIVRILLWFIRGREKLIIKENEVELLRSGTFLIKRNLVIKYSEIKLVKMYTTIFEQNWQGIENDRKGLVFKIQNFGRIFIEDKSNKTYSFCDNLSLHESEKIINEIERLRNVGNIN